MDEVKKWVLNIAAMVVLLVILDLLMPEGRIRKFTQLLSGFMVMFVMINPLLMLVGKGVPASFAGWGDEAFLWNSQIRQIPDYDTEEQSRQILDLTRTMLLEDIKNRLESHEKIREARVDAVLNEKKGSEQFGGIRRLYIHLILKSQGDNSQLIEDIRKELQQVFRLQEDEIQIQISDGK